MAGIDLDALAALLAKATPGPWDAPNGETMIDRVGTEDPVADAYHYEDAALIVAAVNALPALIAYVRELESDRTRLAQINANMAKHDRVAALAMRERCAQACEERALIYDGLESGASTRYFSDKMRGARTAAEECAAAIRALEH